jgi:capsid protein
VTDIAIDPVAVNRLAQASEAALIKRQEILLKAYESWEWYMDRWVNPTERFEGWMDVSPLGIPGTINNMSALTNWRQLGRKLAFTNPYAINGHQNIQNFVAGTGFAYKIQDKRQRSTFAKAIAAADDYWEEFHETEKWDEVEHEVILRSDREGEAFVRTFMEMDGLATVRFIEPEEIDSSDPAFEYGMVTRAGDKQKVIGYVYKQGGTGQEVIIPAEEITFFKKNTDRNVLRGIPTFLPVVEPLEGAKKMLRVIRKMAEIQAAIAVVREHPDGTTGSKIAQLADNMAQRTPRDSTSGESIRQRVIQAGSILDVPPGQKYHFPIAAQSADKLATVIDTLLRACACRVSQPEFLFSANASSSNYASLVAAEQPGMKMFQKTQKWYASRLRDLYKRIIFIGIISGRLSTKLLDPTLKYKVTGPAVQSRDRFSIVRSNDLMVKGKIKSRRTVAEEEGLDFDREQLNREEDGDDEALVPPKDPNKVVGERVGAAPK